ncbi:hypothetical protein [Allorhodopirellula solitaria]|uniref:Transposase IS200-like domain-containing protein n=1 Tax=Allorhodopirellula solitaria TaxID=2527987 RepID=A0A5C5YKP9_9BACT|nr:hypothetical protein [Allorhodopirellula solitaria]TWT75446.1 hypothetical protein CA85_07370 [Allorhodopirellula solitaria]
MPRQARGEVLDPSQVQVVHRTQRCVRRVGLFGGDPLTGNSYEHRRGWIRDRLEFLASVFAIDCLTSSVMHNHIHLALRNRPLRQKLIVRCLASERIAEGRVPTTGSGVVADGVAAG